MDIECMYCGIEMGKKDGGGIPGTTTSICRTCWERFFAEWPYPSNSDSVPFPEDDDEALPVQAQIQL